LCASIRHPSTFSSYTEPARTSGAARGAKRAARLSASWRRAWHARCFAQQAVGTQRWWDPTCARCNAPILATDLSTWQTQNGDWLHVRCWQVAEITTMKRDARLHTAGARTPIEHAPNRIDKVSRILGSRILVCVACRRAIGGGADGGPTRVGPMHWRCRWPRLASWTAGGLRLRRLAAMLRWITRRAEHPTDVRRSVSREPEAAMADKTLATCPRCRAPIGNADLVTVQDGARIHVRCWRIPPRHSERGDAPCTGQESRDAAEDDA
jgi:hypothetical protein